MNEEELKQFIISRLNYHENEAGEINMIHPDDYGVIADDVINKLKTITINWD